MQRPTIAWHRPGVLDNMPKDNGDIRAHHKWWFRHLPKAPGRTNGVANNWWRHVIDMNDPELDVGG